MLPLFSVFSAFPLFPLFPLFSSLTYSLLPLFPQPLPHPLPRPRSSTFRLTVVRCFRSFPLFSAIPLFRSIFRTSTVVRCFRSLPLFSASFRFSLFSLTYSLLFTHCSFISLFLYSIVLFVIVTIFHCSPFLFIVQIAS